MSELELLLREIEDKWTRENFARVLRYIDSQIILDGQWTLFELKFDQAETNYKYKHNLKFVPEDIIVLQVIGDRNVEFNYNRFDRTNIDITVAGACFIRFLAGRFKDSILPAKEKKNLPNVSVGDPGGAPTPLPNVTHLMDCATTVAVDDWVYQSKTINNRAIKHTNNTIDVPTLGIVIDKPSTNVCEVLLLGLLSGTSHTERGVLRLTTTGTAGSAVATTGYIQNLGMSFGNGTIYVNPDKHRLKRTP